MLSTVDINKYYELYLNPIYGGTKFNVQVIGTTYLDSVSKNEEDYNIYQTYFKPIGLGLTSYYSAIQEDTPIYICLPLTTLDPLEIGSEKLFIPSSLVDMEVSDEFVQARMFDIRIYPLIKRIDTEEEVVKYKDDINEKIKNRLKALIDFAIMDSEVEINDSTFYTTKSVIEGIEEDRSYAYNEYIKRIQDESKNEADKSIMFSNQMLEMKNAIKETEKERDKLIAKQIYLDDLIKQYEKLVLG